MKSIIQNEKKCLVCQSTTVHEHHIFGGPNRKKSEKYGLKVYLCPYHHLAGVGGKDSVHGNPEIMDAYHSIGQRIFEQDHTREEFMREFGKSYL